MCGFRWQMQYGELWYCWQMYWKELLYLWCLEMQAGKLSLNMSLNRDIYLYTATGILFYSQCIIVVFTCLVFQWDVFSGIIPWTVVWSVLWFHRHQYCTPLRCIFSFWLLGFTFVHGMCQYICHSQKMFVLLFLPHLICCFCFPWFCLSSFSVIFIFCKCRDVISRSGEVCHSAKFSADR